MKKNIYLMIILFMSLFVFSSRVEADGKVMYLECSYNNQSYVFAYIQSTDTNFDAFDYYVFKKDNVGGINNCASSYAAGCQAGIGSSDSNPILYWVKNTNDFEECVDNCKKIDDEYRFSRDEMRLNISNGICPAMISENGSYLAGTTSNYVEKSVVEPQFVIYRVMYGDKYTDYFEGYTSSGEYVVLTRNSSSQTTSRAPAKETFNAQHSALQTSGKDYFNVVMYEDNRIRSNLSMEVKIDSSSISTYVDKWIDNGYAGALSNQAEKAEELTENSSKVLNACTNINETKNYDFSNYSSTDMISDLETAYYTIASFYSSNNNYNICSSGNMDSDYLYSATDCTLYNILGYSNIAEKDKDPGAPILALLRNALKDEITKRYPDIGEASNMDDYLESLYRCSINLDSLATSLSESNKKKIEDLRRRFEILADSQHISVVEDCQSLIGTDLIEKVKKYTNIIKIAIPILLIGLGTYDFGVAIFAGDDDKMKKAKQQFFMRLVAAILIFLTPTIVGLILRIANSVWSFISPDSCNLF